MSAAGEAGVTQGDPGVGRRPLRLPPQLIVIVLVVALAGAMAIEPTRQLFEQRSRIAEMSRDLRGLQRSNRALEVRIERLKDPDFLEQEARAQLGLVRPGETTYVVVAPNERRVPRHRRARVVRRRARAAPAQPGFLERMFHFLGV
ncbi:MAG: FtsB family cell division protein [Actinomycetota bacterium]